MACGARSGLKHSDMCTRDDCPINGQMACGARSGLKLYRPFWVWHLPFEGQMACGARSGLKRPLLHKGFNKLR